MKRRGDTQDLRASAPPPEPTLEREVGLADVLRRVVPTRATSAVLGPYVLQGRLGTGGMGAVYRAWDPRLERTVALKVLRGDQAAAADLALREARVLARLKHPHVVTVHEIGESDAGRYIAMELVDGPSLRLWIETHPVAGPAEILALFVQAGRGLAAAHAVGVVHRDFKPDNVIVGSDGRVRVVDFGIAEVTGQPRAFVGAGTPSFMAPEQWDGGPADAASDQYSFCFALWRALDASGTPGDSTAAIERPIRSALARGLEPQPTDRWPSLDALLAELAPRDRRRWIPFAVAGVLIIIAATTALWMVPDRVHAVSCRAPRQPIAETWSRARQAAIRTNLDNANIGGFEFLVGQVDGFVAAWEDERHTACVAVQSSDEEVSSRAHAVLDCLDLVSLGLEQFVGRVAQPDAEQTPLVYSSAGLEALASPRACSSSRTSLVTETAEPQLVLEILEGVSARALHQGDHARATLTSAYETAVSDAHHRLASRAAREVATIEGLPREEQLLWAQRALESAELAADTSLMMQAWIRLAYARMHDERSDPAEEIGHAERLGRGEVSARLTAGLHQLQGHATSIRGDHAAALAHFESATRLYAQDGLWGSAHDTRCSAGVEHSHLGDPIASARVTDECLEGMSKRLGRTHPSLGIRLGIATELALTAGDHPRVLRLAQWAIEVGKTGTFREGTRVMPYLHAAGSATELARFDDAVVFLEDGLVLARSLENRRFHAALEGQYGVVLAEQDKCAAALVHYDRAIELEADTTGPSLALGMTFMNRGDCRARVGESAAALADLDTGWLYIDTAHTSTLHLVLLRLDAEVSQRAGVPKRAKQRLLEVLANAEARGLSPADIAYSHDLLARTYADLEDHALARQEVDAATALYRDHADEKPAQARRFAEWSVGYLKDHPR